jgi:hypothetical protein
VPPPAAAAPAAPAARKDPFGFGVGAPARSPAAPPPEEDFGDIDVEYPAAPAARAPIAAAPARATTPRAPAFDDLAVDVDAEPVAAAARSAIELPEEPPPQGAPRSERGFAASADLEAPAPELAPMHAFVPSREAVGGHKPEPAAAAASDGGEALLREALSKASREVIERIVWEVVPQLAETIIRENLDRLVKQRQG